MKLTLSNPHQHTPLIYKGTQWKSADGYWLVCKECKQLVITEPIPPKSKIIDGNKIDENNINELLGRALRGFIK